MAGNIPSVGIELFNGHLFARLFARLFGCWIGPGNQNLFTSNFWPPKLAQNHSVCIPQKLEAFAPSLAKGFDRLT